MVTSSARFFIRSVAAPRAYGRFRDVESSRRALNAVVNGLWNDVYICTDGDCKGYPDATRAFYDPPYEPIAELYSRPPVL